MKKIIFSFMLFLSVYSRTFSQCNTALIISQGHPAFASSVENASYPPGNAFDGDRTTRWSSAFSDPQYLYVDLGAVVSLCQVDLIWEAAYGKDFTIDVANDTTAWTTVATITGNTSLNNTIPIPGVSGRYVRMHGTARGTNNGYSLYGMHVYGTAPSPSCDGTDLALGDAGTASSTESIAFPASSAFDGDLGTRWSSAFSDPQSIYADLGDTFNLCNVILHWESAYATNFTIDVSQDTVNWATLATITGNTALIDTVPVSGLARYVRMTGTARATPYGYSLYEFTVNGYVATTLPIVLGEFNASAEGDRTVLLRWTTEQETNNSHFDILRSIDNNHFTVIGSVNSKGNSAIQTSYAWVDSLPVPGQNEYRLRQVDLDGKYTYSPIRTVDLAPAGTDISVYPNPTTDHATVTVPMGEQIISVVVYSTTGEKLSAYNGIQQNSLTIPMNGLTSGLYLIRVDAGQQAQTFKVLKK